MALRRGFTLVELIIYFMLSALILGLILSLFTVAKRTQQHTYSQYLVGGPIASTIRLLRKELQSTALGTVRAFPTETGSEAPGMSCLSAFDEQDGKFQLGDYGAPHWQKHVFYSLNSEGTLTRWSEELGEKDYLPRAAVKLPSERSSGGRAVMHGLLPPNKGVDSYQDPTKYGGFEIAFVRRDNGEDSLSYVNPTESDEYDTHTRLVQVTLRTYGDRDPTFSEITFRVCPRF